MAWIGDALVEREQRYGSVESAWLLHFYDRRIRVRNLGWTGDTVRGEARSYFGPPEEGFRRLLQHVELAQPTVVLLSYGNNESFDGEAGLDAFLRDYDRLLDALRQRTNRIVLMSPVPVEQVDPPLPDLSPVNKLRKLYTDAVQRLAERRGLCFIDVFHPMLERMAKDDRLTDNGVHLNERGYRALAEVIERAWFGAVRRPPGLTPQLEDRLRELVRRKNEFFFHQYRPQNETYLRGFRKHEQGQNVKELPRFTDLIEKTEQQIFALLRSLGGRNSRPNAGRSSTGTNASDKHP